MSASITGILPTTLQDSIQNSNVLVVGAGGIGCEILKNLVLTGFKNIEIIDLDTIDVSNLNRQFLFHREHVGKSKAVVARQSALEFNPDVNIKAYHDSIFATNYGVNFFKKFDVILNALDNKAARNHVNRMCLNAEVPLVESGTAGYNGQVELIKKGLTQCYECTPKAAQKSFPGCTIRNTPSEPIHCIVWAKHLFNQLFGESIEDEDISPDMTDPEAQTEDSDDSIEKTGNVTRVNTRQWAKDCNYNPGQLFNKFFYDDINYLLKMSNLWETRKPPTPVKWHSALMQLEGEENTNDFLYQYHKIWSLAECGKVFTKCLEDLRFSLEKLGDGEVLVWDKDDRPAMDFVAACANVRAYIFDIGRKTRFETKSMAGNIIPAIATTNAITAGIAVMQAFKVLQNELDKCKSVYIRLRQNPYRQFLVPEKTLSAPNPDCFVCAAEPAIHLKIDTQRIRIKDFRDEVLIKTLNMVNPDVIVDAKGIVIISSEEGETECNEDKFLYEMDIVDGVLLKIDDFFQNYVLSIIIVHINAERDDPLFEVVADKMKFTPMKETVDNQKVVEKSNGAGNDKKDVANEPSTSKKSRVTDVEDSDDDLCLIEDDEEHAKAAEITNATNKLAVTSPILASKGAGAKRKGVGGDVTKFITLDDDSDGPSKRKRIRPTDCESKEPQIAD